MTKLDCNLTENAVKCHLIGGGGGIVFPLNDVIHVTFTTVTEYPWTAKNVIQNDVINLTPNHDNKHCYKSSIQPRILRHKNNKPLQKLDCN